MLAWKKKEKEQEKEKESGPSGAKIRADSTSLSAIAKDSAKSVKCTSSGRGLIDS